LSNETPAEVLESWLQVAVRKTVVRRALAVAVVVGTVLALINHGDYILNGSVSFSTMVKIGITYLVPYGVSTYSSVSAIRRLEMLAARAKNSVEQSDPG